MKSFQENLHGTRVYRQLKHSLASFVAIFFLCQPDIRALDSHNPEFRK